MRWEICQEAKRSYAKVKNSTVCRCTIQSRMKRRGHGEGRSKGREGGRDGGLGEIRNKETKKKKRRRRNTDWDKREVMKEGWRNEGRHEKKGKCRKSKNCVRVRFAGWMSGW